MEWLSQNWVLVALAVLPFLWLARIRGRGMGHGQVPAAPQGGLDDRSSPHPTNTSRHGCC